MWSERKEWIKWKWKTVKTLSTKYIETCFTSSLHVFISFKWNFRVFLSYSIQTLLFFHFISMREPNVASKLLVQFIYCLLGYSEWENAFRAPSFRGVFSMTADKRNYESLHLRSHIGSFHSRFLSFLFSSLSLSRSLSFSFTRFAARWICLLFRFRGKHNYSFGVVWLWQHRRMRSPFESGENRSSKVDCFDSLWSFEAVLL